MAITKAKFKVYNGEDWVEYDFGGSAPSNMVTTDTEQSITGNKIFNGSVQVDYGEGINILDSGKIYGDGDDWVFIAARRLCLQYDVNDSSAILSTDNLEASRTFSFPDKDGTFALTSDIPSTSSFVTTSNTNQTIAGTKTFSNTLKVTGAYYGLIMFEKTGQLWFDNTSDNSIWFNVDSNNVKEFGFMVGDTSPVYIGNSSIRGEGTYGLECPRMSEPGTHIPYVMGYKYCGYIASSSSASTKYYVRCEFIDNKRAYTGTRYASISTFASLREALYRSGYQSTATACPATGKYGTNDVIGIYGTSQYVYVLYIGYSSSAYQPSSAALSSINTVSFSALNS